MASGIIARNEEEYICSLMSVIKDFVYQVDGWNGRVVLCGKQVAITRIPFIVELRKEIDTSFIECASAETLEAYVGKISRVTGGIFTVPQK